MKEIKLSYTSATKGITNLLEKKIDLDANGASDAIEAQMTLATGFYEFVESLGFLHEVIMATYEDIHNNQTDLIDNTEDLEDELEEPITVESEEDGNLNFDTFCTKFGNDIAFREKLFTMYQLYEGNEE